MILIMFGSSAERNLGMTLLMFHEGGGELILHDLLQQEEAVQDQEVEVHACDV